MIKLEMRAKTLVISYTRVLSRDRVVHNKCGRKNFNVNVYEIRSRKDFGRDIFLLYLYDTELY